MSRSLLVFSLLPPLFSAPSHRRRRRKRATGHPPRPFPPRPSSRLSWVAASPSAARSLCCFLSSFRRPVRGARYLPRLLASVVLPCSIYTTRSPSPCVHDKRPNCMRKTKLSLDLSAKPIRIHSKRTCLLGTATLLPLARLPAPLQAPPFRSSNFPFISPARNSLACSILVYLVSHLLSSFTFLSLLSSFLVHPFLSFFSSAPRGTAPLLFCFSIATQLLLLVLPFHCIFFPVRVYSLSSVFSPTVHPSFRFPWRQQLRTIDQYTSDTSLFSADFFERLLHRLIGFPSVFSPAFNDVSIATPGLEIPQSCILLSIWTRRFFSVLHSHPSPRRQKKRRR